MRWRRRRRTGRRKSCGIMSVCVHLDSGWDTCVYVTYCGRGIYIYIYIFTPTVPHIPLFLRVHLFLLFSRSKERTLDKRPYYNRTPKNLLISEPCTTPPPPPPPPTTGAHAGWRLLRAVVPNRPRTLSSSSPWREKSALAPPPEAVRTIRLARKRFLRHRPRLLGQRTDRKESTPWRRSLSCSSFCRGGVRPWQALAPADPPPSLQPRVSPPPLLEWQYQQQQQQRYRRRPGYRRPGYRRR